NAKAYLSWMLFDEQFNYVSADVDPVGAGNKEVHDKFFTTSPVNITKSGYLYIHVSNESNLSVFFDNLAVTHTPGPLLEETHYYPFGLTMTGISSKAMGKLDNKKKYVGNELQSKEFSDGSGLEVYDFNARTYDHQIGRFIQIDPLSEEGDQEGWSPYHYSYNNPVTYSDADGKIPIIPFIIIGIGLLLSSKPAVAPTRNVSDNAKIQEAHNNYSTSAAISLMPAAKEAKVAATLFSKVGVKELAKTTLTKEAAKVAGQEVKTTLKEQADNVKSTLNDGKNSVTIKTPDKQIRYDLAGKDHAGVPTPHKQVYNKNIFNGQVRSISRDSKEAIPMSQADLRIVTKFLEKLKSQE
ncbi:RHS repeat-associated core domain-containing protein, partial [Flavihumibacter sp.]|uniref:RHS repeat-associated core domain-containing protein n=1 Tax=Flavihumibacter sp. TaxID=1913981 RepID=UPI002FC80022